MHVERNKETNVHVFALQMKSDIDYTWKPTDYKKNLQNVNNNIHDYREICNISFGILLQ